jgi:hypothetical protein
MGIEVRVDGGCVVSQTGEIRQMAVQHVHKDPGECCWANDVGNGNDDGWVSEPSSTPWAERGEHCEYVCRILC